MVGDNMNIELRKLSSEEFFRYVANPISVDVPYIAAWEVTYGDLLSFISFSLKIVDTILKQNPGKVIAKQMSFPRLHAVAMKERSNKYGILCGYVELVFINVISGQVVYVCGVNSFPVVEGGAFYFSPATMMVIPEPKKGLDFGEIKIKECKTVW